MYKKWTQEEIAYLINNFKTEKPEVLTSVLQRPFSAIVLKANKMGLARRTIKLEDIDTFSADYNNLSLQEMLDKHNLTVSQLYKRLKKYNIPIKRELTDFKDDGEFEINYKTKSVKELEAIYDTSYTNIKCKASRLGIKRSKNLIVYSPDTIPISEEILKKLYVDENKNIAEISRIIPEAENSYGKVKYFLNKYSIKKPR